MKNYIRYLFFIIAIFINTAHASGNNPTTLVIQPSVLNLSAVGVNGSFTVYTRDSSGTLTNISNLVDYRNFTSSNSSVARPFGNTGVQSQGNGTATFTMNYKGMTASAVVNVGTSQRVITSIALRPSSSTIEINSSLQFFATATYNDGSTADITALATWVSSNTSKAIMSPKTLGLATGIAVGTSNITASYGGQTSAPVVLTVVTPPTALKSLEITPFGTQTINVGGTLQFTLTGTYTDGSRKNLTNDPATVWSSSNISVGTFSSTMKGLISALTNGSTTITASFGGATAPSVLLNVAAPIVSSIAITPARVTLQKNATQQYIATATYTNSTTSDVTNLATWTSSMPSVATFSTTVKGSVTAINTGTANITASLNGIISPASVLTVSAPTITGFTLTPATTSINIKGTASLRALLNMSDGTIRDVTTSTAWSSANNNIATVNSAGQVTGLASGTVIISGKYSTYNGTATVTVLPNKTVTAINITPGNPSIQLGNSQQFAATATFSDASTANITDQALWSIQNVAIASVTGVTPGLISAVSIGTTLVSATYQGFTNSTNLTVTAKVPTSITVTPANPSVPAGNTQQFVATANFADATTTNVTSAATWSSSNSAVASVSSNIFGQVTAVTPGSATISAQYLGITGNTGITVSSSSCSNPAGAINIITCAAQASSPSTTAENYFNTKLFALSNQDGFCNAGLAPGSTELQQYYYNTYCGTQKGTYYSYSNFVNAINTPQFADFASAQSRLAELNSFFATIAQETTSASSGYTTDGLYYRYEAGAIGNACSAYAGYSGSLPCTLYPGAAPYTLYYPLNAYYIEGSTSTGIVKTRYLYYLTGTGQGNLTRYDLSTSPISIAFLDSSQLPAGAIHLNDPQLIQPGMWVGLGATQLTGISLFQFFGWYYQNIATGAPIQTANFNDFVQQYLVDGTLGYQGALWYWMYRVSGFGYRTLHELFKDSTRVVCQGIAAATLQVNGGCNNYNPGRYSYYDYFIRTFTGQSPTSTSCSWNGQALNSLTCDLNLLSYCQPKQSPGACI